MDDATQPARRRAASTNPPALKLAAAETGETGEPQPMPADLGEIVETWPSLSGEHRAIVLSTVRAFVGITPPAADLPALCRRAAIVYQAMLERPDHQAMSRAEMLDLLADHRYHMSAGTLGARIIPQLLARGAVNTPRRGYSIPRRLRLCA